MTLVPPADGPCSSSSTTSYTQARLNCITKALTVIELLVLILLLAAHLLVLLILLRLGLHKLFDIISEMFVSLRARGLAGTDP